MPQPDGPFTGGCQCGAVRFRVRQLGGASICHCRMCQKALGSFFGPFVTAHDLVWTRGAPKYYRSSNLATRGFCADCGTPLSYRPDGVEAIEIAIGTFDDPAVAAPLRQVNPADKLPFFDGLPALPVRAPGASPVQDARNAAVVSLQHPDRDTTHWPPNFERHA